MHLLAQDCLELVEVLKEHVRRHVTVGLVIGISLVTERGLCRVEGDGDPLGFQGLAGVEERLQEAVGDAGRPAIVRGQTAFPAFAEGVETAEGQGVAVHKQKEGLFNSLWHGWGSDGG